jgi:hypothetical protein
VSEDSEANRRLLQEKAEKAFALPGVLALEIGTRQRGGRSTGEPAIVAIVERKRAPDVLPRWQDLGALFGPDKVDVVQASPLQALFANPEAYGVDPRTLDALEAHVGFPFSRDAIGVREPRPGDRSLLTARARDRITYEPPPGVQLAEVRGRIKLRCHAGPDAGWKELRPFLLASENELVAGMYELTAPHIGDLLVQDVSRRVEVFKLTMDKKCLIGPPGMKEFDRHDREHVRMFQQAFGSGFEHANAFTSTNGGTFATDYHIKLVVRDRKAFWLSSGSWQSSNQPNIDSLGDGRNDPRLPICNREWHVIGSHAGLSDVWAKFLEGDLTTAQAAERERRDIQLDLTASPSPMVFAAARVAEAEFPYEEFFAPEEFDLEAGGQTRVMPLLTPDNYIDEAIHLVETAQHQLLVQNQTLKFLSREADQDSRFTALIAALARQSHALRDFRFIVRAPFGDSVTEVLESFREKRFDTSKFRFQPRCHNKGIIADGERVLVGSHNISNAGTTSNRDASLVIHHRGVAEYFAKFFEHDWRVADRLGIHRTPGPLMILARPGELPPPGMKAYRLWDVLDW